MRLKNHKIDFPKEDEAVNCETVIKCWETMEKVICLVFGKQREQFLKECMLLRKKGIRQIILIENGDGITGMEELLLWQNPRMERYRKITAMHKIGKWKNVPLPKEKPVNGCDLAKMLLRIQREYGVTFLFCEPGESAARVSALPEG